jgi:hypothetical protein
MTDHPFDLVRLQAKAIVDLKQQLREMRSLLEQFVVGDPEDIDADVLRAAEIRVGLPGARGMGPYTHEPRGAMIRAAERSRDVPYGTAFSKLEKRSDYRELLLWEQSLRPRFTNHPIAVASYGSITIGRALNSAELGGKVFIDLNDKG